MVKQEEFHQYALKGENGPAESGKKAESPESTALSTRVIIALSVGRGSILIDRYFGFSLFCSCLFP